MKRITLVSLLLLTLYSCSPASKGIILSEVDPICKRKFYITNSSSSEDIVFVYKYTSITKGQVWTDQGEQEVPPKETILLGCDGTADSINYEIIGGYIK
jgi:hypothetical protein